MEDIKYYKSWCFLEDRFSIKEKEALLLDLYYQVYFDSNIGYYIGYKYLNNQIVSKYYYNVELEKIKKQVIDINFFIVKRISIFSVTLTQYIDFGMVGTQVFNFNKDYLEKSQLILNENYELQQYTETLYLGQKVIKEKVFIPSIWQIHNEDYD